MHTPQVTDFNVTQDIDLVNDIVLYLLSPRQCVNLGLKKLTVSFCSSSLVCWSEVPAHYLKILKW